MKHFKYVKGMLIAAGFLVSAYFFVQESGAERTRMTVVELGETEMEAEVQKTVSPAVCTCEAVQPVITAENAEVSSAYTAESQSSGVASEMIPAEAFSGEVSESSGTVSADGVSRVNINTAGREELMRLKGIGETRAEAIIAYREEFGPFAHIEEIMNISGIKNAAFEKIKDDITV